MMIINFFDRQNYAHLMRNEQCCQSLKYTLIEVQVLTGLLGLDYVTAFEECLSV